MTALLFYYFIFVTMACAFGLLMFKLIELVINGFRYIITLITR